MSAENSSVPIEKNILVLAPVDGLAKVPEKACEKSDVPASTSKTGITSDAIEHAAGNCFTQVPCLHFLINLSSETPPVVAPTEIRSTRKQSRKSEPGAKLSTIHVGDHVFTSIRDSEMVVLESNEDDHSGHHQSYAYNLKTNKINMLPRDKILRVIPGTVTIEDSWLTALAAHKESARQRQIKKTPE